MRGIMPDRSESYRHNQNQRDECHYEDDQVVANLKDGMLKMATVWACPSCAVLPK